MNPEIRRQDRRLSESETISILQNGEYGILSMCTPDNEGYGVPLNYVWKDDKLYFHCAAEGAKLDYLRKNARVSFCVVGTTKLLPSNFGTLYESAIVSGIASEAEGDEKREALMRIIEKYSADFIPEGKAYIEKLFDRVRVVKLSALLITGKARKQ